MRDRGRRLLPHVVDGTASENPDQVVGLIAKPSATGKKPYDFKTLSISQFANAVNYTALWLDTILGSGSRKTIGYIGIPDFRYSIMEIAAIKTGNTILLPSSRNALLNTIHLLKITSCEFIFYSGAGSPIEAHVNELQEQMKPRKLEIHEIPTFSEMITTQTEHYPYNKTYEEAKDDIVMVLHTSGSTSCPKPINITNAYLKRADSDYLTPPIEGRIPAHFGQMRSPLYNGSPFFHLSGVVIVVVAALFSGVAVVIGPPEVPTTPAVACDIARSIELKTVVAAPHVIDALFLAHGEELKEHFSRLDQIIWFGGPLAHSTGDWITTRLPNTHLWQFYGSTEMGWFPMLVPPKSHWSYFEFHPVIGPTFEHVPNTDLYRIVIYRNQNPDALKVNPLHIEVPLQSHPILNGVLVFGDGRLKCGILLEPKEWIEGDEEKEELVKRVWGDIERANGNVPEHARVERELVLVADRQRPLIRSAKGTIVRSATGKLYETDIEEVYAKAEKGEV